MRLTPTQPRKLRVFAMLVSASALLVGPSGSAQEAALSTATSSTASATPSTASATPSTASATPSTASAASSSASAASASTTSSDARAVPPPRYIEAGESVSTGEIDESAAANNSFALERFEMRASVLYQEGLGWQSQASTDRHAPGSEELLVVQPILAARVRTGPSVTHDVALPVDIVSAASPDAIDAVSSASRDNESFTLDIYSNVDDGADTDWTVHWGGHIEETFRSGWLGGAISREVANDNAVLRVSTDVIFDWLDPVWPNGYGPSAVARWTATVNGSVSQLLSESTMVQVGYGFTAQFGQLATTWNSIPWQDFDRIEEVMPRSRARHAASITLDQAILETHTFARLNYRFYIDDYGIVAHTPELLLTQYLGDDVWIRAGYRFHNQTAARFYTELWQGPRTDDPRTADSDLAGFDSHEIRASVRWFYEHRGIRSALRSSWVEFSFLHYERTNQLNIQTGGVGWGHAF